MILVYKKNYVFHDHYSFNGSLSITETMVTKIVGLNCGFVTVSLKIVGCQHFQAKVYTQHKLKEEMT